MAITREQKSSILEGYEAKLSKAQLLVWANYKGLTVAQIQDLRKRLRPSGAEALVVKNSLMRKALEEAQMEYSHTMMSGASVVTFIYDDIPMAIKTLTDFARERDAAFVLQGGLLSGQVITVDQVRDLAYLPSREVLLARVVGGIQAPISGFVSVLAGVLRGLPNVLTARGKQLESAAS
ncbi:MAG: 50S ribosomal protein L10 [Chloroflexi bacterium]|nr:50S ribosomal protein L10 [Chloroflexota bacterium]